MKTLCISSITDHSHWSILHHFPFQVHEMDEEVEKNRTLRESLELEKQIFRQRLLAVQSLSEDVDCGDEIVEHAQEQPRFKIFFVSLLFFFSF